MKEEDESKWVADDPHSGLMLVAEGDPPPGAHMGHMSFSSFNPELQKLQVAFWQTPSPFFPSSPWLVSPPPCLAISMAVADCVQEPK